MTKYADRVKETALCVNQADITLTGAFSGFRRLQDVFSVNDYVQYMLLDANGTIWERGYGLFDTLTTLVRSVVLDSTSGPGVKPFFSGGTHTLFIGAAAEWKKTEGVSTTLAKNGVLDSTWTDLVIGSVAGSARPGPYDTSGILPSPGPHTSLVLPNWVERISVNASALFYNSTPGSGGSKTLLMAGLDNSFESNGMVRDLQPSTTDASNQYQRLKFSTGIIDVPVTGGRGFKVRVLQTTGVTIDVLQGWLTVEFVE